MRGLFVLVLLDRISDEQDNDVEGVLTLEEARKIDRAILCQKIIVETVYKDESDDNMDYVDEDEEVEEGDCHGQEKGGRYFEFEDEEDEEEEDWVMDEGEDRIKEGGGEGDVEVIGRSQGGQVVRMHDVWEYNDTILECTNCWRRWPG
jgi:hypothetical protein